MKAFDEPAHSLSLHPTGYLLLAGFADKLRLMSVLSGGWVGGDAAGARSELARKATPCRNAGLPACWCLHVANALSLTLFEHRTCLSSSTHCADDLRVIKELPIKAARDCCFSNGGQYFAAVNGNTGEAAGTAPLPCMDSCRRCLKVCLYVHCWSRSLHPFLCFCSARV